MMRRVLLSLALACAASACAGGDDDPTPDDIDLTVFDHPADFYDLSLEAITPAQPFDYLELRESPMPQRGADEIVVLASVGARCASASDLATCVAAFEDLWVDTGFHYSNHPDDRADYLVVNRGDSVEPIGDADGVRALLGTVDNRDEALLLVAAAHYGWTTDDLGRGAIREVAGGYEVIAVRGSLCPIDLTGYLLFVSSSGAVEIREQWVIVPPGDLCS